MKPKIYIILILLLIFNAAIAGAANYGGNLKIKVELRPFNLNPLYAENKTETMINKQIFDTLVVYNNQKEITANLAESWEINNESNIFKFNLKKDVYFHPYKIEGEEVSLQEREVSAEDWKWSFEYLAAPGNRSLYAELFKKIKGYDQYRHGESSEISGIRVKDKYQLEIELKESYAPFIYNLAKKAAVVMPAGAVKNSDFNFSTAPVGTGAFKYSDFSENEITLIKNNDYWKNSYQKEEQPYLNQIAINFAAENNFKENLKEFDLYQLNSQGLSDYQSEKDKYGNYQLRKLPENNVYFAGLNYKSNISRDNNYQKLQGKLSHILNKNDVIKNSNSANYICPAADSDSKTFLHYLSTKLGGGKNIDFNQSLKKLRLTINNSRTNIEAAENMKQILKSENISLQIKKYSWTEYINRLESHDINSHLFIMSANYNNRFEFIYNNLYSNSKANYFGYQNKRLDNLIDYLKLVNSEQELERAFEIITDILIDDNPFIFIFQEADSFLVSDRLVNQDIFKNSSEKYDFERLFFK